MDPMSQIVVINIGNVVAWLAAIYAKDALRGLIGNLVVSTLGAFGGAQLALGLFPGDVLAMILGAFVGATALLSIMLPVTRQLFKNGQ